MIVSMDDELLTTDETAAYLRFSPGALVALRYRKSGPPYSKLGQAVRYSKADLDRWVADHRVDPGC